MKIERLKKEEYPKLAKVEEGYVPDPEHSIAIVAKDDDDQIVGRVLLIRPFHIEGTWIAPQFRKTRLGVRLFAAMEKAATDSGLTRLFSYVQGEEIAGYMERLGYKQVPATTVWVKDI